MNLANKMCEKKTEFKTQVSIWIIELRPIEAIALLINAAMSSLFQVLSLQPRTAVLTMISNFGCILFWYDFEMRHIIIPKAITKF